MPRDHWSVFMGYWPLSCTQTQQPVQHLLLVVTPGHTPRWPLSAVRVCNAIMVVSVGAVVVCIYPPQKETPLANAGFWAARKGNLALLQLLLNSGRVDADCRDSVRTLHAAQPHAVTVTRLWQRYREHRALPLWSMCLCLYVYTFFFFQFA